MGDTRRRDHPVRDGVAVLAAVVLGSVLGAPGALAQAVPPPVVSVVADGGDPTYDVLTYTDCEGEVSTSFDATYRVRVETDGPAPSALTVGLVAGGSLQDGVDVEVPSSATVAAGESAVVVDVELLRPVEGTVTVTASPGAGYAVGAAATATLTVERRDLSLSCGVEEVAVEARVGDPEPDLFADIRFPPPLAGASLEVVGDPPPVVDGALTTAGTYRYTLRYSLESAQLGPFVALEVRAVVVVRPAAATPGTPTPAVAPPAAGPARPVAGTASYTG